MVSTILKANGDCISVEPRNNKDFQLAELQAIVGGYIEIVRLNKTQIMVVDEEGKCKGKPLNLIASMNLRMAGIQDTICGDALICDISKVI